MPQHRRPKLFGIKPRHERADDHRQRNGEHDNQAGEKRAEETAEQIVELVDLRRADHRRETGLIIADDNVSDERDDRELAENRHDRHRVDDRERAVDVNVAGRADLNEVDGDAAERQQEKDNKRDPKDRVFQLIAELERSDFSKHRTALSDQAAREAASVEK